MSILTFTGDMKISEVTSERKNYIETDDDNGKRHCSWHSRIMPTALRYVDVITSRIRQPGKLRKANREMHQVARAVVFRCLSAVSNSA